MRDVLLCWVLEEKKWVLSAMKQLYVVLKALQRELISKWKSTVDTSPMLVSP